MSGIREQLFSAIFAQESNSGKAKTDHINEHGVTGPMQVQDKTFEGLKRLGLIPREYQHTNPEHNTAAGRALINHLADKYNDDPAKVAAAYYGGEKAVRPDGTIADFRDKKNPNNPSVKQYVSQVIGRLGLPVEQQPVAPEPAQTGPFLSRRMPGPAKTPVAGAVDALADKLRGKVLGPAANQVEPDPDGLIRVAAADTARNQAEAQAVQDSTLLDKARASFADQPLGAIGRYIINKTVQEELPVDPNYRLDPRLLEGRSTDEQDELVEDATSAKAEQRILMLQEYRRDRQREAGRGGAGAALVAGLVAGLPEGALTGLAAFRTMQVLGASSARLAQQGRLGAAASANAAENLAANVGLVATQQALDGYVGVEDYAMAAAGAALGSAMNMPSIYRQALMAQATKQADVAAAALVQKAERAAAELGENATPEQIRAKIRQYDVDESRAGQTDATELAPDRRFFTTEDDGSLKVDQALPTTEEGRVAYRPLSPDARPGQDYAILGAPQFDPSVSARSLEEAVNHLKVQVGTERRLTLDSAALNKLLREDQPGLLHTGLTPKEQAAVEWLHQKFMPDGKLAVVGGVFDNAANGDATFMRGGAMVRINARNAVTPQQRMTTIVHELGHAIWKHNYFKVNESLRQGARLEYMEWLKKYHGQTSDSVADVAVQRTSLGAIASPGVAGTQAVTRRIIDGTLDDEAGSLFEYMAQLIDPEGRKMIPQEKWAKYVGNFEEFTAEQFSKYIEASIDSGRHAPPQGLKDYVVALFKSLFDLFTRAKEKGLLGPTEGFREYFDAVFKLHKANATKQRLAAEGKDPYRARAAANMPSPEQALPTQPWPADVDVRNGLDLLPEATPAQVAEKRALIELYRKAENPEAPWNNIDPAFIDSLTANRVFDVSSTSLRLFKSSNPVARMIAAELLESPSGAAGRRASAAIKKHLEERRIMGNSMNDFQTAYATWRKANGGNIAKDALDGEHWARYNREVALHIETGQSTDVSVLRGAAILEQAYERSRALQVSHKTIGWASLPEAARGYMPHRMSPGRVRELTTEQTARLHTMLVDQFVTVEGWDITFSANLASRYLEVVKSRAVGDYDAPFSMHQTGAAEAVEDAMTAMGMPAQEVRTRMGAFVGAMSHTKKRLKLDLSAELGDGKLLLDVFETDQLRLLRTQAQRVAGEAALARHGVMGKPGLKLLRRALAAGGDNTKAQADELEAFDQVAAEFLGEPFGDQGGRWLDRAVQFNSLARLGGMGFTQLAEFINGIVHVGAYRTMAAMGGMRRLRSEIIDMANGRAVDNPILGSLEKVGGAEFGTDSYKLVFPFDNPDLQYQVYGRDTPTAFDRLLRGGSHLQGQLSFWRAIHSSQQRGMAEQIVRKATDYIRRGADDVALDQMGIDAGLRARIANELNDPAVAQFGAGGELLKLDVTRFADKAAAEEFVQAVHRGSAQIIQGTFIGETGKWAHSGLLRLVTQFRTFSITSIEKQWTRQKATRGPLQALGILLGAMSMAAPIYMARTYVNSIGREDQAEYLEQALAPEKIARATLNYVALSGLSGDLLDALSAVSGVGEPTGGRAAAGSQFVGNVIAPAAGLADDLWQSVQNTKEGTDPSALLRSLPFSKLPYMIPAVNYLGQ